VVASGTTIVRPGWGVVVAKPEANGPNAGPAMLLISVPTPQVVVAVPAEAGTAKAIDKPSTTEAMIRRLRFVPSSRLRAPDTPHGLTVRAVSGVVNRHDGALRVT
jgi:hypothetical protein